MAKFPLKSLILCIAAIVASVWVTSAWGNSSVLGKYQSDDKDICYVGSPDRAGNPTWTNCSKYKDQLTIIPSSNNKYEVELLFAFTNGHSCSLLGTGELTGSRMTVFDNNDQIKRCPLTINFQANTIRLGMSAECHSKFCGSRGYIDGIELRKVTR